MQQFGTPGGKVVLVTSALTDEGRTFLARELALSFARAGGQTLLVDFDLRMPSLHETFEVAERRRLLRAAHGRSGPADGGEDSALRHRAVAGRAVVATLFGSTCRPTGSRRCSASCGPGSTT